MPLFTRELNELADYIGRSTLTFFLHTAAPTDADPDANRVTAGGTGYENGVQIAASDISNASSGDIDVDVDVDFGQADEDVGTVTHLSAYRGSDAVGYWSITSTTINDGDTFKVNLNTINFNGSTT